jgi:hypothetical protein
MLNEFSNMLKPMSLEELERLDSELQGVSLEQLKEMVKQSIKNLKEKEKASSSAVSSTNLSTSDNYLLLQRESAKKASRNPPPPPKRW